MCQLYSCSFIGCPYDHLTDFEYKRLKDMICDLIDFHGVREFYYSGYSNFDRACLQIVKKYNKLFPFLTIRNIFVSIKGDKEDPLLIKNYDEIIYYNVNEDLPFFKKCFLRDRYLIDKSLYIILNFELRLDNEAVLEDYEYAFNHNKIIIISKQEPINLVVHNLHLKFLKERKNNKKSKYKST